MIQSSAVVFLTYHLEYSLREMLELRGVEKFLLNQTVKVNSSGTLLINQKLSTFLDHYQSGATGKHPNGVHFFCFILL